MSAPLSILCLGDSYTIGEAVSEEERWPSYLSLHLTSRLKQKPEIQIIAKTGWTTDELFTAINEADLQPGYDLVTLMIGVNDQYRERSIDRFAMDFAPLVNRAVELALGKCELVFCISIPDWGVMPFAKDRDPSQIADQIDAFNQNARTQVLNRGINWIDVTECSREAATNGALVASDDLHPSKEMHRKWAEIILGSITHVIGND